MNATRRDFLKVGAAAVAVMPGVSTSSKQISASAESRERATAPATDGGNMIYRRFGSPMCTFPPSGSAVTTSAMC